MNDFIQIRCERKCGYVNAYVGDCVGITFAVGGHAHNVVTHEVSRALTTMCDHDIGVVVKDER